MAGGRVSIDSKFVLDPNPSQNQQLMQAWWKGRGLAGRCPGCGNYVLFTVDDKQAVIDPTAQGLAVLPDDWHQHAYLLG